jgi:putative ABC transport system permease protein
MIKTHFVISVRHLLKNKVFTAINILGLAVAIAAAFLIIQYVGFELSYDRFHTNESKIYRVAFEQYENGSLKNSAAKNFMGLGHWINDQFPEVEHCTRFWRIPANSGFLVQYQDKIFNEPGTILVADSTFFQVFPSLLQSGHPSDVLKDLHSLVLSEKMARKIFGNEEPVGKLIPSSDYNREFLVTGIMRDLPENSHLVADFITRQDYTWDAPENYWQGPWRFTYLTLNEKYDFRLFEDKLNKSIQTLADEFPKVQNTRMVLQPLSEIHLHSNFEDELRAGGSQFLVYILLSIALIILLMAWINYVNIETSRFIRRSKEICIRKIVGSGRASLLWQFLTEYAIMSVLALVVAVAFLFFITPRFSYLTGIPIQDMSPQQPQLFWIMSALFVSGSLVVGVYPFFLLPRIHLVSALKGKATNVLGIGGLRKSLVVFQFTSSIVLVAFVLVLFHQLDFMRDAKRKIELENVVAIKNPTAYSTEEEKDGGSGGYNNFVSLRNKLLQHPGVKALSGSSAIPGSEIGFTYVDLLKINSGDPYDPTRYKLLFVDYDFIPLYNLKVKAGRNYSTQNRMDEHGQTLILNERAVYSLGFASLAEALNQEVSFMVDDEWIRYTIVGIVEDYHHEALKHAVHPTVFFLNHNRGQQVYYSLKLSSGADHHDVIAYVEKSWKEIFPDKPLEYFFIDEYYDQQFKSEQHFGRIFSLFAGVALFIACLGILSMTLFEIRMRTKEVSIRKVLGASERDVVVLLSRRSFTLILLASLLAGPITYFASTQWLLRYPLRIEISWWFYVVPVVLVFGIVFLATGVQMARAVRKNPVDSLKNE